MPSALAWQELSLSPSLAAGTDRRCGNGTRRRCTHDREREGRGKASEKSAVTASTAARTHTAASAVTKKNAYTHTHTRRCRGRRPPCGAQRARLAREICGANRNRIAHAGGRRCLLARLSLGENKPPQRKGFSKVRIHVFSPKRPVDAHEYPPQ